jgi:hypothetical protein
MTVTWLQLHYALDDNHDDETENATEAGHGGVIHLDINKTNTGTKIRTRTMALHYVLDNEHDDETENTTEAGHGGVIHLERRAPTRRLGQRQAAVCNVGAY